MAALTRVAGIVVLTTGLWLVGFAVAVVILPRAAERFVGGFASSARAHYLEQGLRLVAGAGLVGYAAEMRFPEVFRIFGWLVLATTAVLVVIPWRWHHRFGQWAVPLAVRHIRLYALAAFMLGAVIFVAAITGPPPGP